MYNIFNSIWKSLILIESYWHIGLRYFNYLTLNNVRRTFLKLLKNELYTIYVLLTSENVLLSEFLKAEFNATGKSSFFKQQKLSISYCFTRRESFSCESSFCIKPPSAPTIWTRYRACLKLYLLSYAFVFVVCVWDLKYQKAKVLFLLFYNGGWTRGRDPLQGTVLQW